MNNLRTVRNIFSALDAEMASGFSMSGGEETFATWDAAVTLQLDLWKHDPSLSAEMVGMNPAEQWQFIGENLDQASCERIASELDCSPLGMILAALDRFHNAVSDDILEDSQSSCENMQNALHDVQDLAPQWYKDCMLDLYGTGFPGDESLWDPHERTELCAMLAIGSL